MSLTGRFSALFLAALGLVLVGFSTALYVSARIYLDRRVARAARRGAGHPGGGGRDPSRRRGVGAAGAGPSRWARSRGPSGCAGSSSTTAGRRVDHSRNLADADLTADMVPPRPVGPATRLVGSAGRSLAGRPAAIAPARRIRLGLARPSVEARRPPPARGRRRCVPSDCLVLTVCAPLGPTEATLATLGWLLAAPERGDLAAAALLCRRLSRRALRR